MRSRMGTASAFAADDFRGDAPHQLTKWRSEFTAEQIETIIRVADAFGLGFYTEEPHPDYEQLNSYQLEEY